VYDLRSIVHLEWVLLHEFVRIQDIMECFVDQSFIATGWDRQRKVLARFDGAKMRSATPC
jgi:hypothetical protein